MTQQLSGMCFGRYQGYSSRASKSFSGKFMTTRLEAEAMLQSRTVYLRVQPEQIKPVAYFSFMHTAKHTGLKKSYNFSCDGRTSSLPG